MFTKILSAVMAVVALGVFTLAPVAEARGGKDRAAECPRDNRCK